MTTANLVVAFATEKEKKIYWSWHDGYQVDEFFKKAIKMKNLKTFEKEKFENFMKEGVKGTAWEKDEWVGANEQDGRGDWAWSLTVVSKKEAVLVGADSSETKIEFLKI